MYSAYREQIHKHLTAKSKAKKQTISTRTNMSDNKIAQQAVSCNNKSQWRAKLRNVSASEVDTSRENIPGYRICDSSKNPVQLPQHRPSIT